MQPIQFFAARHDDGALLPNATIDVYLKGTQTRATLYADDNETPLGNPAYADAGARVFLYTTAERVDIQISKGGYVAPLMRDILVVDVTETLAEMQDLADQVADSVVDAAASADAAAAGGEVYASTADALSNGVYSLDSLVVGSGGTDGTFALAFSGGAGSGAAGWFAVAGGAINAYEITARGRGYTSAPTVSFAASAGLSGASAVAVIAANRGDGQYFSVPSPIDAEYLVLYFNDGGVATAIKRYPSAAAIDALGVQVIPEQEPVFSVVDEDGRRTWLETDIAGLPTNLAKSKLLEKLDATREIESRVGLHDTDDGLNDPVFSITDSETRRTWLEFDSDGKPTARAGNLIKDKIGSLVSSSVYSTLTPSESRSITSGPNITMWGDSMTAGAGSNGNPVSSRLQAQLDADGYDGIVYNRGVGGESSVTIAARANGTPLEMLIDGGEIPASGVVGVTLRPINGVMPAPLLQGVSTYTGMLAGVAGTFSRVYLSDPIEYTFTRTTSGDVVSAPHPVRFYQDVGAAARGDIQIIWIGQNGPDYTRAIQDAWAIIHESNALNKRYLVISKPGGSSAQDAEDAVWFSEFGNFFIPIRQYMVEFGLAEAGITPTSQDDIDVANGTVPTSLRIDGVHWNEAGYQILANYLFRKLKELRWI